MYTGRESKGRWNDRHFSRDLISRLNSDEIFLPIQVNTTSLKEVFLAIAVLVAFSLGSQISSALIFSLFPD